MGKPLKNALSVIVAPWQLSEAAARTSQPIAWLVGSISGAATIGIFLSAVGAGMSEPFRSIPHYALAVLETAIFFAVIPGGALPILLLLITAFGGCLRDAGAARLRVLILAPATLLIPITVFSFLLALADIATPTFDLLSGKPGWVNSRLLHAVASLPVLLVTCFLALVNCVFAISFAPDYVREPGTCEHCRYDLTGNTSGRCPECGHSVTMRHAPRLETSVTGESLQTGD